jgi:hypothetical protein
MRRKEMEEEVTTFLAGSRPDRSGGARDRCETYGGDISGVGPKQPKELCYRPHQPTSAGTRRQWHGTKVLEPKYCTAVYGYDLTSLKLTSRVCRWITIEAIASRNTGLFRWRMGESPNCNSSSFQLL